MSYIRYFMPMISEATGYGFKGRQPAGRSIVEGRDSSYKLTIWAQDLKAETFYNAYLLFAEDGRYAGIAMGALQVDEKGKGEMRRDFDQDVLCGFGLTDIVAVVVLVKDAAGVVSPLCGYRDRPISWRHGFYEYVKTDMAYKNEDVPVAQLIAEPAEHTPPAESVIPTVAVISDVPVKPEDGIVPLQPVETEMMAPPDVTLNNQEPVLPEEEACRHIDESTGLPDESPALPDELQMPAPSEEAPCQEEPASSEEWRMPAQHVAGSMPAAATRHSPPNLRSGLPQEEISQSFRVALDQLRADTLAQAASHTQPHVYDAIFETREPIVPFQNQARETIWVSFNLSDQVPPPTNRPHLFEDPFVHTAIAEYEHLILGMTIDQGPRRYIIGVPGAYGNDARQRARKLGFTQFKTCNDSHPSWGELGYWLMFVTV